MKLYHGTSQETKNASSLYFTPDINVAKEYALGLDICGNYNEESFIYSCEIDEKDIIREDDFEIFDCMGYSEEITKVIFNEESGYYIVPNPILTLVEHYKNEL